MRAAVGRSRWALSFADLSLLLLGFFVLLQARPASAPLAAGLRHAFGAHPHAMLERPADSLFEPGEAVLRPDARVLLRRFAHGARDGVLIASRGTEAGSRRFDGWELAAARAAAVARELAASGVPEARIRVAIDPRTGGGQMLQLSRDGR